jgi:hypothetical protein
LRMLANNLKDCGQIAHDSEAVRGK